jgi:hypothetical protein
MAVRVLPQAAAISELGPDAAEFAGFQDALNTLYEVEAYLAVYDDGNAENAYATTERHSGAHQDGSVLFGKNFYKRLRASPGGMWKIRSILAHEWGHVAQFRAKSAGEWAVRHELSADFIAGWYLRRAGIGENDRKQILDMFASLGNTDYTDEDHHGTASQRGTMLDFGLQADEAKIAEVLEQSYRRSRF